MCKYFYCLNPLNYWKVFIAVIAVSLSCEYINLENNKISWEQKRRAGNKKNSQWRRKRTMRASTVIKIKGIINLKAQICCLTQCFVVLKSENVFHVLTKLFWNRGCFEILRLIKPGILNLITVLGHKTKAYIPRNSTSPWISILYILSVWIKVVPDFDKLEFQIPKQLLFLNA